MSTAVPAAPPAAAASPTQAPAERANLPQTIWVGNLAPTVTDQELAAYFADSGRVVSAKVVRFGKRSLRYGFVEFSEEGEAIKATAAKNDLTFNDRQIKVQRASPKPRVPRPPRDPNAPRPVRRRRIRRPRPAGEASQATSSQSVGQPVAAPPVAQTGGGGGRRRGRGRPPQQAGQPQYSQAQYAAPAQYQGQPQGYTPQQQYAPPQYPTQYPPGTYPQPQGQPQQSGPGPRRRRRNPRRRRAPQDPNAPAQQQQPRAAAPAQQPPAPRPRRQPRPPVDNSNRELSDVLVFVANLPYSYDDEKLKNLFAGTGATIASAHAVRTQRGSAKGFGFVETVSQDDQTKALKLDGVTVDERVIAVKVAYKPLPKPVAPVPAPALS